MLFYGRSQKIAIFAVDTASGIGKVSDASNLTLKVSKDGAANAAASNTPTEIGYGLYSLELTASECSADLVCVSGVSSTSGVSISPIIATTEAQAIPYAAAGAASGLALTSSVSAVETKVDTVDSNLDAVKVVTDALPDSGALSSLATASALATVDSNVDDILTDTSTTIPGTIATVDANVDAVKVVTDALPDSGALSSLATASALATVDTVVDSISSTLSSGVTVAELASAAVTDVWSTYTVPESYASSGAASTPAQLWYLAQAMDTEKAISSTTVTLKKLDQSTTAATFTLDSSTSPTSITRAS